MERHNKKNIKQNSLKKKVQLVLNSKKINEICSPYLKNQLKYSFYLLHDLHANRVMNTPSSWSAQTMQVHKNIQKNYFYRILNINNFLLSSSFVFGTQMLFYKKGFIYLGFCEQPKKTIIEIKNNNICMVRTHHADEGSISSKLIIEGPYTPETGTCMVGADHAGTQLLEKRGVFFQPMIIESLTINFNRKLNYFNYFSLNQRVKIFQIWLKKAFLFKNIFLKNYKKGGFLQTGFACMVGTDHAGTTSKINYFSQANRLLELKILDEKNIVNRIVKGVEGEALHTLKKKYKIYSQSTLNKDFNMKRLSSLLTLSVKPGWFYFTKNLSKFLLYNRNFIHPGKIIGEDFIFDHEPVYLEILTFGKELENIKSLNFNCIKSEKETHTCIINNEHAGANNFSNFKNSSVASVFVKTLEGLSPLSLPRGFSPDEKLSIFKDKQNKTNLTKIIKKSNIKRFTKVIKNNKCRFEPDNLKEIFQAFAWSEPSPLQTMQAQEGKIPFNHLMSSKDIQKNKGFFILIRKASEYKLHKDFQLKKEMHKLSNQPNFNNSKTSIFKKTNSFFRSMVIIDHSVTKKINQYKLSSTTPLKFFNFSKVLEKRKTESSSLNLQMRGYNGAFTCMVGADHAGTVGSNQASPGGDGGDPKEYDTKRLIKKRFSYTIKNSLFLQNEKITIPTLSYETWLETGLSKLNLQVGPTMEAKPKYGATIMPQIKEQSYNIEFINVEYPKENTVHLFNKFQTPFINKQKIASEIISKYPSSDLKIFSKIPFYSSLLILKNKLFKSFQSEIYNFSVKKRKRNFQSNLSIITNEEIQDSTCMVGIDHAGVMINEPLLEKNIKISKGFAPPVFLQKHSPKFPEKIQVPAWSVPTMQAMEALKKISLTINKQNSWGIPLIPITAKGSINLSPFIISYKSPNSIEFPFKYPIRFFYEQNHINSVNKIFSQTGTEKPVSSAATIQLNSSSSINNCVEGEAPAWSAPTMQALEAQRHSVFSRHLKKILNNYRLKINKLKDLKDLNNLNNFNMDLNGNPRSILSANNTPSLAMRGGIKLRMENKVPAWSVPTMQVPLDNKSFFTEKRLFEINKKNKIKSILSTIFFCPIAEYSLGKNVEKSILYPNNIISTYPIQNTRLFISNQNFIYNKKFFSRKYKEKISFISSNLGPPSGPTWSFKAINRFNYKSDKGIKSMPFVLGSLNNFLDFSPKYKINNEIFLYKTEFESFLGNKISPLLPFINSYNYCCFEGELIFKSLKYLIKDTKNSPVKSVLSDDLTDISKIFSEKQNFNNKINKITLSNKKKIKLLNTDYLKIEQKKNKTCLLIKDKKKKTFKNLDQENLENDLFSNKRLGDSCIILTKKDQLSFYLDSTFSFGVSNKITTNQSLSRSLASTVQGYQEQQFNLTTDLNYKQIFKSLEDLKKKNRYLINETIIKFLNISDVTSNVSKSDFESSDTFKNFKMVPEKGYQPEKKKEKKSLMSFFKINKLPIGPSHQKNKLLLGEFLVYGDQISPILSVTKAGQIIHINNKKITLRHGQPIFVSPKAILHKYDTDFIDEQSPVITLSYQQLKTGDIIQGIPKVEQFFEARTTKRGRLFRDSLKNLLKGLFRRYSSKGQPSDQAVRQSFYKIQQIIVDGVQRVYRSQGVSIADKHLEVIVKQMTSKVRITEGGQTGFFPGEIVDLNFIEQVNTLLMRKITYEPLVLGITKASLEVDSFLSAASFQQTTRVLSNAALSRKKDFLKGLKENVILGNLIPAGTGYLVYLD